VSGGLKWQYIAIIATFSSLFIYLFVMKLVLVIGIVIVIVTVYQSFVLRLLHIG